MSTDDVIEQAARVLSTHETFTGKPYPRDHNRHQARSLDNAGLLARPLPTRDEIADELRGWPIVANGYYQTQVAINEARDMADVVLDLLKGQDARATTRPRLSLAGDLT